ncbi:MAG TPA: thiamine phosphate synthase [Bacteroidia bacterium]|jgi:thiamine-phosphate pyrophosphorylase|nr:thiamine phosphate synthase [Bacteroidia bacterium]
MKLLVLSPSSGDSTGEPAIATKLFEHGLETYHLRKPRFSTKEMSEYLDKIPSQFHKRIVIHSHHKLALRYNLKGIHLTRTHLHRKFKLWINLKIIRLKRRDIIITTSFRKLASLYEEENIYSYVFLSPVFDSISGSFQAGYNEHSLKAAIQKTPFTIIARGGVTAQKIQKVRDVGFAGLILNTTLWKADDPVKEFSNILDEFKRLEIVPE